MRTLGVVGAGQMGAGIAQVAATAGLDVLLHDRDAAFIEKGLGVIASSLKRLADKGTVKPADVEAICGRVRPAATLDAFAPCDFVVEAVNENLELKRGIFTKLDAVCRPGVILASNTSSLSITRLAAVTKRPERTIGMHFMNPVPIMALVEIIPGQATSKETLEETRALTVRLGKTPVTSQDYPGFISNRILMPMINEAICALHEGVGTREDIDAVMTLGMRHPMGPLALADFIGLDTCLAIMEVLFDGFGDPKYRPSPLLRRMVDAGWLGKKSGRGFYDYSAK
ncbi:MAG TPA: 3-hydroxybutyryl-CoA dehydrogenase [Verrucomicrobiae bacterium]|nr:3-hydroxybutyryl-CoA dehydrogenase [Verrucomicrobiae bacterium]